MNNGGPDTRAGDRSDRIIDEALRDLLAREPPSQLTSSVLYRIFGGERREVGAGRREVGRIVAAPGRIVGPRIRPAVMAASLLLMLAMVLSWFAMSRPPGLGYSRVERASAPAPEPTRDRVDAKASSDPEIQPAAVLPLRGGGMSTTLVPPGPAPRAPAPSIEEWAAKAAADAVPSLRIEPIPAARDLGIGTGDIEARWLQIEPLEIDALAVAPLASLR